MTPGGVHWLDGMLIITIELAAIGGLTAVGYYLLATTCWLLSVGYYLMVTTCWLLQETVGYYKSSICDKVSFFLPPYIITVKWSLIFSCTYNMPCLIRVTVHYYTVLLPHIQPKYASLSMPA